MNYSGDTWLILGTAPGAQKQYPRAAKVADVVCTCNGGLSIEPTPSWYWLSDPDAAKKYIAQARHAISGGSRLVTSSISIFRTPSLSRIAHTVISHPIEIADRWTPGQYANGRTSGCFLTQFAINNGAKRVLLVGMGGYQSSPRRLKVDYFDGRKGGPNHKNVMAAYGPLMQSIIEQSPRVEFVLYGRTRYQADGPNVRRAA